MRPLPVIALAGLALAACASKPRAYDPTFASPPSDPAAAEAALATCRTLVAQGRRSNFANGATTAVIGAGAAYAAGATVMSGAGASLAGTAGAASAAAIAMPVVGIVAIVAVSRHKRNRREKEINGAMSDCLAEHGHSVADWRRVRP